MTKELHTNTDSTLLLSLRASAKRVQELENSIASHEMVIKALESRGQRLRAERDNNRNIAEVLMGVSFVVTLVLVIVAILVVKST